MLFLGHCKGKLAIGEGRGLMHVHTYIMCMYVIPQLDLSYPAILVMK